MDHLSSNAPKGAGANALTCKLQQFTRLSLADRAALERVVAERRRTFLGREDISREGDKPTKIYVMLNGWACRYKFLEDGRRQIVAFFLPGDLCDLNIFILRQMDHSIGALTDVTVAEIGRDSFERLIDDHPRITQALWWEALVTIAIQREWTVNLGQRDALERIAHLLCELYVRLWSAGLATDGHCAFPVTQSDLADATGLSKVHVNRTLQELRQEGLIRLANRQLTILDLDRLKRLAVFDPNYLHLDREGAHLDANNE
ncbi:Crp/Fnr family transcriptional regulator [Amaricoccus solimangrovi]|uniref:Crp/Fnr family transcriptional regulator n=1 Tax=Amaricoccus solimangrovi TaxID=2589815 RepID=A0A501WU25_9RHOB|nr:Crp/Fnr family transcriptional regulator [Amaricoccus solimangrovi]TPE51644.1 Crp/Fnr family transcriptional regulator [Amaricoccus solimangrovi]